MRFRRHGPDLLTVADEFTEAYAEVFTAPPWKPRDSEETPVEFRERLETDGRRPVFRAVRALSEDVGWTVSPRAGPPGRPSAWSAAYGKVTRRLGADRAWLMTWSGAPDAVACCRHEGWWEPEPVPGEETDIVVFMALGRSSGGASGLGARASGRQAAGVQGREE
ncbi:hypothetical protein ABTX62_03115 [Streptomyces sp. NPDC096046]|uniref:hypothetical protein n=1 Tax=Streptomyces sp. NPDC096046 TaxID=3155542 RepID=UPI00332DF4DD